jgi:hypothetical protein
MFWQKRSKYILGVLEMTDAGMHRKFRVTSMINHIRLRINIFQDNCAKYKHLMKIEWEITIFNLEMQC